MKKIPQTKTRTIVYGLKKIRNKIRNSLYINKDSNHANILINQLNKQSAIDICITVAFNTPWTISLLIDCWLEFCKETKLVVADNSSCTKQASEIKAICESKQIPYIKLPPNPVTHPSRSHGLALNWIWKNIVLNLDELQKVGFIDHDCYPIRPCRPNNLSEVFAYGVPKLSWIKESQAVNIWAGFMFFSSKTRHTFTDFNFNFLPDILNGLDTGGMNWERVYKHLNPDEMDKSKFRKVSAQSFFQTKTIDPNWSLHLIDETFVHLSGVSHKKEFESFGRIHFCKLLRQRINPLQDYKDEFPSDLPNTREM